MTRQDAIYRLSNELHQKYEAIYQRLDLTAISGNVDVTYTRKTPEEIEALAGEMLDREITQHAADAIITKMRAA